MIAAKMPYAENIITVRTNNRVATKNK